MNTGLVVAASGQGLVYDSQDYSEDFTAALNFWLHPIAIRYILMSPTFAKRSQMWTGLSYFILVSCIATWLVLAVTGDEVIDISRALDCRGNVVRPDYPVVPFQKDLIKFYQLFQVVTWLCGHPSNPLCKPHLGSLAFLPHFEIVWFGQFQQHWMHDVNWNDHGNNSEADEDFRWSTQRSTICNSFWQWTQNVGAGTRMVICFGI